jgi:hypothetical protein
MIELLSDFGGRGLTFFRRVGDAFRVYFFCHPQIVSANIDYFKNNTHLTSIFNLSSEQMIHESIKLESNLNQTPKVLDSLYCLFYLDPRIRRNITNHKMYTEIVANYPERFILIKSSVLSAI